jgi:hypothetical protein
VSHLDGSCDDIDGISIAKPKGSMAPHLLTLNNLKELVELGSELAVGYKEEVWGAFAVKTAKEEWTETMIWKALQIFEENSLLSFRASWKLLSRSSSLG